jgi:hypothetical protein
MFFRLTGLGNDALREEQTGAETGEKPVRSRILQNFIEFYC